MRLIDAKTGAKHSKIKTHFARIIVGLGIDNPYYSILYYDPADDEFHQGFGSKYLDNVIKWLSEEFEIIGDVFWCEPVRHGRWVKDDLHNTVCSVCGERIPCIEEYDTDDDCGGTYDVEIDETPCCPHCGAKMRGDADAE